MLYTGVSFPPEKARGSGYNERVSRGLPLIGCRHRSARPSSAALPNLHQQTRPRDWLASESLRKHIYLCVYVDNLERPLLWLPLRVGGTTAAQGQLIQYYLVRAPVPHLLAEQEMRCLNNKALLFIRRWYLPVLINN